MISDIKEKKVRGEHHVKEVEFWRELARMYDTNADRPSEKLSIMVQKIVENLFKKANFSGYTRDDYDYKDDMIGDAKVKIFDAIYKRKFIPFRFVALRTSEYIKDDDGVFLIKNYKRSAEKEDRGNLIFNHESAFRPLKEDEQIHFKNDNNDAGIYLRVRNNPFNYFTTIAFTAFQGRIKLEAKNKQIKKDWFEKTQIDTYQDYDSSWSGLRKKFVSHEESFYDGE